MANKAWVDAVAVPPRLARYIDTKQPNGKQTPVPVKGKDLVSEDPLMMMTTASFPPRADRDKTDASTEVRRREPPPHLRSSTLGDEKQKTQFNGWSKVSTSPTTTSHKTPVPLPPANGTTSRVVIGFKPTPTGPRNSGRTDNALPLHLSSLNGKATSVLDSAKSRTHTSRVGPPPPARTPPPPPPPQEDDIPPPPSPPLSRKTTPPAILAHPTSHPVTPTEPSFSESLDSRIPPPLASVYTDPPESTRHVPGRGNFRVCDPSIHHTSTRSAGSSRPVKAEVHNDGCGLSMKHDHPITRYDGAWKGKDVNSVEVRDLRLDIEKSLREKGAGSKKNAYKGLIQVEPYQWDENSPFPKPPPPPEGICIWNINPLVTVSQIEHALSVIGKPKNIDMKLDPRTGMQMGICHVTFQPGEERREVPASRSGKKPRISTHIIPAWQIASNAQKALNGKSIGMAFGKQKESVMKVVLDGNGDKARKLLEAEVERKKRTQEAELERKRKQEAEAERKRHHTLPSIPPSMTSFVSSARPNSTPSSTVPAPGATPAMPSSTRVPLPTPSINSQPRSQMPPKSEFSPSKQSAPHEASRVSSSSTFSRTGGGGYGVSSASGWSQSKSYRGVQDIGRLPPVASSSYNTLRMPVSTSSMSNSYTSFISAPFAKSHPHDSRAPLPSSRGGRDDESHRYGSSSYQDPPARSSTNNNGRQLQPSALESYHRRSSRSRRSSSVSRTESDGSESEETSSRGRTPSPVQKRGMRRGSDRTPRNAASRGESGRLDPADGEQLVNKVKSELRENGRSYIFIDHKSLPIPHKLADIERNMVDLTDHLKAVKIEKVTYNLYGWYILFPDDTTAKRTQMVFDKKVMNGRPLALTLKGVQLKGPVTPAKASLKSPAKPAGDSKKADSPLMKSRNRLISPETDEPETVKAPQSREPLANSKRGTKKQKSTRTFSSDDDEVSQIEERTAATATPKSAGSAQKDLDVASETVEDAPAPGKEDLPTATSTDMVDENTDAQPETPIEPLEEMPPIKAAGKSKRKSTAIGKPAKQPAKKKQKKAASTAVVEDEVLDASPMEDIIIDPVPIIAKPSKAPSKSQRAKAPVPSENLLSLSDLVNFGIAEDDEDLYYLRLAAEHSVNQTIPDLPAEDNEEAEEDAEASGPHPSGCARSHGYYKVPEVEKSAYLPQRNRAVAEVEAAATNATAIATSRSTRVNSRRLVQGMEQHKKGNANATDADMFQFNQLRTRKKQLKFSKSPIHDWGLYAMEHIIQGEMVIEYVGEVIRAQVADIREKWYEKTGIGSSYLFRVDDDAVVDATKKGNLGRLINHCCYPNCTAKIITINGEKKIVIYAKWNIEPGEEITYDYHFPIEQEKIPCLCGSDKVRSITVHSQSVNADELQSPS
ncbi:hypothetical protein QFC22_001816 [Naganishia vaughanmartiniae]|uniref:Uncharacterized protein n=1 Tax=Naganishia vaughanmartiniae TaxID=1424756 RepID=A0ACC2XED3_9TREE|nr:hypothetical protein QFC22_001816 [Naganishia vaughanmartiniae]